VPPLGGQEAFETRATTTYVVVSEAAALKGLERIESGIARSICSEFQLALKGRKQYFNSVSHKDIKTMKL